MKTEEEIQDAEKLGIKAEIKDVDFKKIMEHMREPIQESRKSMEKGLEKPVDNFGYYKGLGQFVSDYTIKINDERALSRGNRENTLWGD